MPLQQYHIRFRELRALLGLSQADFADALRIKQPQVSQIETGERDISDAIYQALAHHLHVSRQWIENGTGEKFTDPAIANQIIAESEKPEAKKERQMRPRSPIEDLNMREQAARLTYFRKHLNKTTKEMSDELGINKPTYWKYENAQIFIPVEVPMYLHLKYRMRYEWYFHSHGECQSPNLNSDTTPTQ